MSSWCEASETQPPLATVVIFGCCGGCCGGSGATDDEACRAARTAAAADAGRANRAVGRLSDVLAEAGRARADMWLASIFLPAHVISTDHTNAAACCCVRPSVRLRHAQQPPPHAFATVDTPLPCLATRRSELWWESRFTVAVVELALLACRRPRR